MMDQCTRKNQERLRIEVEFLDRMEGLRPVCVSVGHYMLLSKVETDGSSPRRMNGASLRELSRNYSWRAMKGLHNPSIEQVRQKALEIQAGRDFEREERAEAARKKSAAYKTKIDASREKARRIAACWNACQGLSTDALENIALLGDTLAERFKLRDESAAELIAQRDELLTALKSYLRAPSVGSNGPGSATIVVQEFNVRAAKAIVDRLTKTTPTAGTPGQ